MSRLYQGFESSTAKSGSFHLLKWEMSRCDFDLLSVFSSNWEGHPLFTQWLLWQVFPCLFTLIDSGLWWKKTGFLHFILSLLMENLVVCVFFLVDLYFSSLAHRQVWWRKTGSDTDGSHQRSCSFMWGKSFSQLKDDKWHPVGLFWFQVIILNKVWGSDFLR